MEYKVSDRAKKMTLMMAGLGLLLFLLGIFTDGSEHAGNRFWSNLLINGFFFFAISLGAMFFLALHYATETGWGAVLRRVIEAVVSYMPIGAAVLLVVFLASIFDLNHIYHWMEEGITDPKSHHYDAIIAGKSAYLNKGFFGIRSVIYLATFLIGAWWFRKTSLKEDEVGGIDLHFKMYRRGALFLVLFAVFSSTLSWDWLMSIDPHWYSTLFGWYVFSGMWVTAMTVLVVLTLYLRNKGFLPQINDSHVHDLGKWVFAISFLWSYLWFSQFMLIWYAQIPEEVTYYIVRIEEYKVPFFAMFAINFILPMVLLMSREAKRSNMILTVIGAIIFVGHWMDVYMMVTPGTMFGDWHLGLVEVGMFMLFLGTFILWILNYLKKAPLVPQKHPMMDESLHHEI
jgi:hypothetical protein